MQRTIKIVGLLLLTGSSALSTSATSKAAVWLRGHKASPDELAELKAVNPDAYAIVKALLTKRSLGLLDPRHPSPSFAAPPPGQQQAEDDAASGVQAFAKIAQESGEKPKADLAYPDAPAAPSRQNWLSWKPTQSAADDASVVDSVASAEPPAAPAPEASTPPAQSAPPAQEALPAAQPATSAMNQENSYLKGIDFFGAGEGAASQKKRHSLVKEDSHDYLAGFSFDDDASAPKAARPHSFSAPSEPLPPAAREQPEEPAAEAEVAAPEPPAAAAAPAASKPAPKNALLAWLVKVDDSKPAAPAAPKSSGSFLSVYLKDLQ